MSIVFVMGFLFYLDLHYGIGFYSDWIKACSGHHLDIHTRSQAILLWGIGMSFTINWNNGNLDKEISPFDDFLGFHAYQFCSNDKICVCQLPIGLQSGIAHCHLG
ncbi:unnamed protein product [Lactuca virosa]|uniref:Uncharacterized protein n=1 Tax=Lactuca virosa TaxID=75947 RepID=A0AAU9NJ71_9ASTR|nr:unnamed protein product [Lactuca virosa]